MQKSAAKTASLPIMKSAAKTASLPMQKSAAKTASLPMQKSAAKTASLPMQKSAAKTASLPIMKSAANTESSFHIYIYIHIFSLGCLHQLICNSPYPCKNFEGTKESRRQLQRTPESYRFFTVRL